MAFFLFFSRSTDIYFFFFQAEDGIRDTSVTGVQTCALPILAGTLAEARELFDIARSGELAPLPISERPLREAQSALDDLRAGRVVGRVVLRARSEERRVGKECRSLWSPLYLG